MTLRVLVMGLCLAGASANSGAVVLNLQDWGLNLNGTTYCDFGVGLCDFDRFTAPSGDPLDNLPASVDISGFDFGLGLGTLDISLSGADTYSILGFFDLEIEEASNTFFNEFGEAVGTPEAGQSFEIDEIGLVFGDLLLDVNFDPSNFFLGDLDNSVGVGPGDLPDDVAMAMGWAFDLGADEQALVSFSVQDVLPQTGFYLRQVDATSGDEVFLSSTLTISGQTNPIPGTDPVPVSAPSTAPTLALGLLMLAGMARRLRRSV